MKNNIDELIQEIEALKKKNLELEGALVQTKEVKHDFANEKHNLFYKSLTDKMSIGFIYGHVIYLNDLPIDFKFLSVNSEFENITGLSNINGKKASELNDGLKGSFIDIFKDYSSDYLSNNTAQFEKYIDSLSNWYSITLFSPEKDYFVVGLKQITDRKKSDAKLNESKTDLADAQRLAHIGSWHWDLESNSVRWSDELHRIIGLDINEPVPIFENMAPIYTQESWIILNKAVERTLNFGEAYELDIDMVRYDGRLIHTITRGTAHYDLNGKIISLHGTVQDITERKLAERALRESEDFSNSLLRIIPFGMDIVDEDGTILFQNEKLKKITGKSSIGDKCWSIYHDDNQHCENCPLGKVLLDNDLKTIETQNIFGGKSYEIIHTGMNFHGKKAMLQIFKDITERKEAEMSLRLSEEKYRSLFSSIQEGFALHEIIQNENGDPINYRFLEINPAFENLTGLKAEEIIGRTVLEVIPNIESSWIENYGKVALTGTPISFDDYSSDLDTYYHAVAFSPKIGQFAVIFSDITERKKAEKELLESETKFKNYIQYAPHGIFIADEMGNYIEVNNAAADITLYSKEELLSMNLIELVSEEYKDFVIQQFKAVIDKGFSSSEFAFVKKDKSKGFWTVDAVKLTDNRYLGFVVDITERKNAEEALRESESRFRDIVFSASDWIWEIDADGKYIYCSEKIEAILGYKPDEIIGLSPFDLMPPNEVERILPIFQKILESKSPIVDLGNWNIHKNGSSVYLLTNGFPVIDKNGNVSGYRGADKDITERKKAEEEILKLSKVVEQSPVSITITDKRGIIEYVNPKTYDLTSFSHKEIIGKNPRIFKSGQTPKSYYKEMWDTILAGKDWKGELLNKRKDGSFYWESVSISPLLNDIGEILNFIAIKEDITERKQTEKELKDLNDDLKISKDIIQESLFEKNKLVEELSLSEEKLKESVATKDKFFSIIAHDLKGPFSGFLGLTDLMAKEADELSVKEIKRMSEIINNSANSVYKLIEDLLQWSRTQRGTMPFFPETLDVFEISFNTVFSLQQTANNKNIKLIQNIKQKTMIIADRNMITTVFRNLVSNAIKFTHEGGGVEIGEINIENNELCFYIKDNGVGISKSTLDSLFQIDSHASTPGTNKERGTGLGLILCKEFIQKHGGKIWAESEVGKGSTFFFSLPK